RRPPGRQDRCPDIRSSGRNDDPAGGAFAHPEQRPRLRRRDGEGRRRRAGAALPEGRPHRSPRAGRRRDRVRRGRAHPHRPPVRTRDPATAGLVDRQAGQQLRLLLLELLVADELGLEALVGDLDLVQQLGGRDGALGGRVELTVVAGAVAGFGGTLEPALPLGGRLGLLGSVPLELGEARALCRHCLSFHRQPKGKGLEIRPYSRRTRPTISSSACGNRLVRWLARSGSRAPVTALHTTTRESRRCSNSPTNTGASTRSPADGETETASGGTPRCLRTARCRSTAAGRVTASSFSQVSLICRRTAAVSMVAGRGPPSPTGPEWPPPAPAGFGSTPGRGKGAPLARSKASVVARWATPRRVATV